MADMKRASLGQISRSCVQVVYWGGEGWAEDFLSLGNRQKVSEDLRNVDSNLRVKYLTLVILSESLLLSS